MRYFFLIAFCFISFLATAQAPSVQQVRDNLETLGNNFPEEKIYIHFDKAAYSTGETIWFKAYLSEGNSGIDYISKTLYVDFADENGRPLLHFVAPISYSSARGQFDIPKEYKFQSVHVKAYTRWMLNFDSSFLYNKDIRIIQQKPATKNSLPVVKASVQFFPEGGYCVADIKNKIAFKAIQYNGKPANIYGSIVNSKGAEVAKINCLHDGMGFFFLEPSAGETYKAKWKDEAGTAYETPLPEVKSSGVNLEVTPLQGRTAFVIRRSENIPGNFSKVNIVGTMEQQLVYLASVKLDAAPLIGGSIPTDQLPSGILQITLFDSNWVAFAERICFVNNGEYIFEPEVGFATLGTGKRGRNVLVISMPDSVEGNLSVSVTDAEIGKDSSDDIISRFLMTGDLKGSVYKPSYYLQDNSDSLKQHLDLVMLTNGWRRIKWDDVVKGKLPDIKYQNDTSYLSLGGKVYGMAQQDLRQGVLLMMILDHAKDSTRNLIQTIVQKDGSFSNPDIIFQDTLKVYYKLAAGEAAASAAEVTFNNGILPNPKQVYYNREQNTLLPYDTSIESRLRYFAKQQALLAKLLEGTTLEAVTVKAKTKSASQILDEKYASGLFSGGNASSFDVANDPFGKAAVSVLQYLKGRVAGLQITGGGTVGIDPSLSWRGGTPAIYLDQVPVDITQIENIPMSDVAYVKVFQPPFFGGFNGGSGAIAVYTNRGGSSAPSTAKGLPFKLAIGYTPQKEFYSPNYAGFSVKNEADDVRSTLYWNPSVITTTENHIIKLPFYNNDVTTSFRVIVEGVSTDGRVTRVEKVIE